MQRPSPRSTWRCGTCSARSGTSPCTRSWAARRATSCQVRAAHPAAVSACPPLPVTRHRPWRSLRDDRAPRSRQGDGLYRRQGAPPLRPGGRRHWLDQESPSSCASTATAWVRLSPAIDCYMALTGTLARAARAAPRGRMAADRVRCMALASCPVPYSIKLAKCAADQGLNIKASRRPPARWLRGGRGPFARGARGQWLEEFLHPDDTRATRPSSVPSSRPGCSRGVRACACRA